MAGTSIHITDFRTQIPGALVNGEWQFPTLSGINSHRKETFWRVRVRVIDAAGNFVPIVDAFYDALPAGYRGWINVDSGVVGGKTRATVPTIISVAKSANNPFTQALRDALGMHNKKQRTRGAAPEAVAAANGNNAVPANAPGAGLQLLPPMLAQVAKMEKIKYPIFVQRKLNGVRAVTSLYRGDAGEYEVVMYSRRKIAYPGLDYIKGELATPLREYWDNNVQLYLDGEIYLHGATLQDISGAARRGQDATGDPEVKYNYMIYDCFVANQPALTFTERQKILDNVFAHPLTYSHRVETYIANDAAEVRNLYNEFIATDYEGAMLRLDLPYRYSFNEYHSDRLLKLKPTLDAELEIVGWETGKRGKAAGALMIICQTPEGKQFPVTPAMEIAERIELARKMAAVEPNGKTHFENHWLGKRIIVEFDELSRDKVPQRARTRMIERTWD